jgi:predicted PurR-regulated permease PerM
MADPLPTLHVTPRSIVRAVLVAGTLFVLFAVASRATETLWWFAQAAAIAALVYPLVQRMSRRMPAFVAVLLLTLLAALVAAGLAAVVLGELRTESQRFRAAVPGAVDRLERSDGLGSVLRDLELDDSVRSLADQTAERARFDGPDLPGLATAVGGRVSAGFVVWILTVMLVFTGPGLVRSMVEQAPQRLHTQIDEVLRAAYGRSVRYVALTALRSLTVAALVFVVAKLLGLDMPGVLAILAALCAFVPYVGVLLGALPMALMALVTGSTDATAVLVGAVLVQVFDALVLQRRIDARSMQLGLFPTLVAGMLGFHLHGPGGLLIGVAIAAMVVAVVNDTGAMRVLRGATPSADGIDVGVDAAEA